MLSVPDLSRDFADALADGLPPLLVDRQRVIQSAAFRRLQYKTQVFVAFEQDHFRTRLTHTLEVAQVARALAHTLELSADLAEVVALAHDLGHAPFGHAGERALDECLRAAAAGGFEHNAQSLRVVEYLEHPYPGFRGLNLTRAVRQCLATHETRYDKPGANALQTAGPAPLEGRVAALADQIAYCLHDLQDGLFADLFTPADLDDLRLWAAHYAGPPITAGPGWRGYIRPALDSIQQALFEDLRLASRNDGALAFSRPLQEQFDQLADFLRVRVYRDHRLIRSDSKARRIIHAIFEAYVAEPQLLPARFYRRVAEQGAPRVAADYIAGMTDRFCLDEHARLFDPRAPF